jgi:hypothetical protein
MSAAWFSPPSKALDANASPYGGATWSFYQTGTLTPLNVYADASLSTSLGAVVTADSSGKFANIYFDSTLVYRGVCKDSSGAITLHDIDPVNADVLGFSYDDDYAEGSIPRSLQAYINVKDAPFNAKGDDSTDDTAAIAAAITAALTDGKAVYLPAGTYKVSSRTTVTFPNPAVGPEATNYFAQLSMWGDGFGRTRINCTSSGFIKVIGSSQQHSVELLDFAVTTGGTGASTAIELDCSIYPFFAEHTVLSRIKLEFRGNDGVSNVKYWGTCVDAIDWGDIDFTGSDFNGASTPAGRGVVTRVDAGTYNCKVWFGPGTKFRFLATGYEYGDGTQSAFLETCFFGLNVKDVYATVGGANHQGLSINNCECYELATGPFLHVACDVPNVMVTNSRIAVGEASSALIFDVTNQTTITSNQFFPDTTANTAVSAIDIAGTVAGSHCIIDINNFAGTTIGARLLGTSKNVRFGAGNTWTGGMVGVTDAGSDGSNVIGAGYAPGWGGVVTQLTSKSTGVTLNAMTGKVTTHDAALGATTEVAFTVTNSFVNATDNIIVNNGNGNYRTRATDVVEGSFVIRVRNETGGSLGDAVDVSFSILRGAVA